MLTFLSFVGVITMLGGGVANSGAVFGAGLVTLAASACSNLVITAIEKSTVQLCASRPQADAWQSPESEYPPVVE